MTEKDLEIQELRRELERVKKEREGRGWISVKDILGDEYDLNRLRELAQADREGRVVVLPCKTVFEIIWDAGPDCDLACPVSFDGHGDCNFCDHGKQFVYERACKQAHLDQIGKTVFLTREEAEVALEAQKGAERE